MDKTYSVRELTHNIKSLLEGNFSDIAVEGEVSNYRPSQAGHLYFSLKDSDAVISCVMFRARTLGAKRPDIKDGALLRVKGRLSVYPPHGGYQIVCDSVENAGEGNILLMLEKRKRAFAAEGLFAEERKKPLPHFPETVAVITAKTGAAIHDIITTLKRRAPIVRVIVLPAVVQGADAARTIASRIKQANLWKLGDVIIVGRGGGSVEDLLPFSDEAVVRAVADSAIPIVSAVGHDVDWALCDYAADLRAPTPTAAAELVSEDWQGLDSRIADFCANLADMMGRRLDRIRLFLKPFSEAEIAFSFRPVLQSRLQKLDDLKDALLGGLKERIVAVKTRVEREKIALDAGNPLTIMEKGYSVVTRKASGGVIKNAADVHAGDALVIRFAKGSAEAEAR